MSQLLFYYDIVDPNDGVMVRVLASCLVDCGLGSWSGQAWCVLLLL